MSDTLNPIRSASTKSDQAQSLLAAALGDFARARGMTEIAKSAGITREALYKALRPESSPRFDTVQRVCSALGVRLVVQPFHP
jgi:probable addiction module antidote protein